VNRARKERRAVAAGKSLGLVLDLNSLLLYAPNVQFYAVQVYPREGDSPRIEILYINADRTDHVDRTEPAECQLQRRLLEGLGLRNG
jgi:hypothetical protein